MYETYTYEQIKSLPDNLKIEALKELTSMFPSNKELAEHLGVIPIVTSNMIKRYIEGKTLGRKTMTPEEKAQAKVERELKKQQEQINTQATIQDSTTIGDSFLESRLKRICWEKKQCLC